MFPLPFAPDSGLFQHAAKLDMGRSVEKISSLSPSPLRERGKASAHRQRRRTPSSAAQPAELVAAPPSVTRPGSGLNAITRNRIAKEQCDSSLNYT
jgi:hypothetical protein